MGLPVRGKRGVSTGLHLPFTAVSCRPLHGTVPLISGPLGFSGKTQHRPGENLENVLCPQETAV